MKTAIPDARTLQELRRKAIEKDRIQMAALVALRGQLDFLARFQACVMERFDAPLSRVSSAIFDLYDNNIDPLLQPWVDP